MKMLIELFITFFKTGLFTFGGGYAMLPMLQREVVDKKKYVTNDEVMEFYAIGQCTPGLIAVNTSTFIGYKKAGIPGGIVATLGFICPSVIIISLLAGIIDIYADLEIVRNAFGGIRACVCILILNAVIRLWRSSIKNTFSLVIFVLVLAASVFFNINPVILILAGGVIGIIHGVAAGRDPQVNAVIRNDPSENDDPSEEEDDRK